MLNNFIDTTIHEDILEKEQDLEITPVKVQVLAPHHRPFWV